MESFFRTLKTELVHHEAYATREEARQLLLHGILQRRAGQLGAQMTGRGAADDPARAEIDHCGQVQSTFASRDIRNVRDPGLIRHEAPELLIPRMLVRASAHETWGRSYSVIALKPAHTKMSTFLQHPEKSVSTKL
jgi:hypothetical protein